MEHQIENIERVPDALKRIYRCPDCGGPTIMVPGLHCGHCDKDILPRCFVYRRGSSCYIAECVDLDLLSQGSCPDEAVLRLQEAIYGYLETAFSGGSTRGLVLRKSPLSHRLRYHARRAVDAARHLLSGGHSHVLPIAGDGARFCHF